MSLKGLSGICLPAILPVFWRAANDNRPTLKHALGKRNLGGYASTVDDVLRGGGGRFVESLQALVHGPWILFHVESPLARCMHSMPIHGPFWVGPRAMAACHDEDTHL